jgi:hypothetical protein
VAERARELTAIATWLRDWAADPDTWDANLICLGDFNIDRRGSHLWQAFTSTGLTVPEQIDRPRMVAGEPLDHYYDQIAWFTSDAVGTQPLLSLDLGLLRVREPGVGKHRLAPIEHALPDLGPLSALGRVRAALVASDGGEPPKLWAARTGSRRPLDNARMRVRFISTACFKEEAMNPPPIAGPSRTGRAGHDQGTARKAR